MGLSPTLLGPEGTFVDRWADHGRSVVLDGVMPTGREGIDGVIRSGLGFAVHGTAATLGVMLYQCLRPRRTDPSGATYGPACEEELRGIASSGVNKREEPS